MYVKPSQWNALISQSDVVVVDVRNLYETRIGSFRNSLDPKTSSFRHFPAWVNSSPAMRVPAKKPRIAMYCTGGIRCEKASSFMLARGFTEVYHLEGGILKYLEEIPDEESLWDGECFVFDKRAAVGPGLRPGSHRLCFSCKQAVNESDMTSPLWEEGVSCPHCYRVKTDGDRDRARARQTQFEMWGVVGGPDKGRRESKGHEMEGGRV